MVLKKKVKTFYANFLGFLVKNGKKILAKTILDTSFFRVSRAKKISIHLVLIKIFLRLNSFVETKKVRIRRSTHIVPFSITTKRKSYLAIKWIMQAVKDDKRKVSICEKLTTELLLILSSSLSKAQKKRKENIHQALSNRSNVHFRW